MIARESSAHVGSGNQPVAWLCSDCRSAFFIVLSWVRRGDGSELTYSDFWVLISATKRLVQLVPQPKEGRLPAVPGKQSINDPTACANDLSGDIDHGLTKRGEIHPQ